MGSRGLHDLIAWARGTDLLEVLYRRGPASCEFRLEGREAAVPEPGFPASALVPVTSPAVGFFRWAAPGKPRLAHEGKTVRGGDRLGLLETGGAPVDIPAPASGKLVKVLAEEGKVVEYGQPLFILLPETRRQAP